jgi:hypothetical protein
VVVEVTKLIPVLYGTYYDLLMFIKDQEQPSPSISNIRSPSVLSEDINNDNNFDRIAMQQKMTENLKTQKGHNLIIFILFKQKKI